MIYLDNAATTRTDPEVAAEMLPFFSENYGNPSGIYGIAQKSRAAVTAAREKTAHVIGCRSDEIYFTSCGSEADNWALKAAFEAYSEKGNHIITTKIEHPAILNTCEYLERERGAEITRLDVDEDGVVDLRELEAAIRPDTILISVMTANNEIGTIEPIREIGEIARRRGVLFHTDAVQAFGQIPMNVDELNIDMLSASAHKFNGPKGAGFLYIRKGVGIRSFLHGGAQEHNRRAGTENVPGIVGLGAAAKKAEETLVRKMEKETRLRDYLIRRIREEVPNVKLNGPDPADAKGGERLPNNVNFSFEFVEGESLLIMLDMRQICASSGSACSSGSLSPSHVLKAIGLSDSLAHGALRLTLSAETTAEELDTTVEAIREIVERLRGMSPKYEAYRNGTLESET
ncbi:MAG: cysteine desulfurase NifS [Bilifractor sp.]|jgi:cysteine desulfurase